MRHIAIQRLIGAIRDGLRAHGLSVRGAERQAGMPQRAIQSVLDGHDPHLSRAADIAAALGYELVIRPRGAVSDTSPNVSPSVSPIGETDLKKKSAPAIPPPGSAWEPVPDRGIAEILAALADEYEALNDHGRESLRMQVWAALPHLRERERTAARVVAWLGWRVVEGRAAASKKSR